MSALHMELGEWLLADPCRHFDSWYEKPGTMAGSQYSSTDPDVVVMVRLRYAGPEGHERVADGIAPTLTEAGDIALTKACKETT